MLTFDLPFSPQALEQLRSLTVAAASGMGLIGIASLITLMIQMQKIRAELLEKRSPKALNDALTGFDGVLAREAKELAAEVEAREAALTESVTKVELYSSPNLSRIAEELGQLKIYAGSPLGAKLLRSILKNLGLGKLQSTDPTALHPKVISSALLPGYEESLQRQIALVSSLGADSQNSSARALTPPPPAG